MTIFDFRATRKLRHGIAEGDFGGGYVEFDELLASGAEVALEEDSAGHLVLSEGGEFE